MSSPIPSIDQLQTLGLPAPVSYMPQTWGWWVLLGLLIVGLLAWSGWHYWQWQRNRYRREALARLAQLHSRNELSSLRELPELLKRVGLSMPSPGTHSWTTNTVGASLLAKAVQHPKLKVTDSPLLRADGTPPDPLPQVAALGGTHWQAFLEQHSPTALPADFSQQLAQLAYAPDATLLALPAQQREQLFSTCKRWVEHHHVAA
ncbi:DUF4381 domain-containing protein [Pseudomonas purpurea]|uniref:DUF4381 domain-containing protein n=1 Tax=Pseudomonas purpurea TaxID=3136737 RepID=UPI003263A2CA